MTLDFLILVRTSICLLVNTPIRKDTPKNIVSNPYCIRGTFKTFTRKYGIKMEKLNSWNITNPRIIPEQTKYLFDKISRYFLKASLIDEGAFFALVFGTAQVKITSEIKDTMIKKTNMNCQPQLMMTLPPRNGPEITPIP